LTATGQRIRAVLFDKDGTLFDFHQVWVPAYRAAARLVAEAAGQPARAAWLLEASGFDPASGRFAPSSPLISGAADEISGEWAALLGPGAPADIAGIVERTFDAWSVREVPPAADLEALFSVLSGRGLKLGIATMDSRAALEATLSRHPWRRYLAFTCGYDSGFGHKPGAGMVRAFAAALRLDAAAVAVVGDSLADIRMARAAGAGLALAVATGATPAALLAAEADAVLPGIAALEAHLAALA